MSRPSEPDQAGGRIAAAEGLAAEIGLQPGDELLAINHHPVRDVIDVQFYGAEPQLELLVRRAGELWLYEAERSWGESLGLSFEHPTFDTDIRRCNNRCDFCFVSQMAPAAAHPACRSGGRSRFRRSLYVKDDDYRYSFLEGNYVTLTNLDEADWERIEEQRLSPLFVSVHATDPALRRRLLGNPAAPDILDQLRRLVGWGIEVHTQLVIVPGVNDGESLARSVTDLAALWPGVASVSVVPVGLTRFHRKGLRPNTAIEAATVLNALREWQRGFWRRLGDRFAYASDEWYLLAGVPLPPLGHYRQLEAVQENGVGLVAQFLAGWARLVKKTVSCRSQPADSQTWVTGTLFGPVLRDVAAEYTSLTGAQVEVVPIVNTTLGETVTVAGLLLAADVIDQLRGLALGQRLLLPEVMFRGPAGVSLDGLSVDQVGQALGRPARLAAGMDDVWQL